MQKENKPKTLERIIETAKSIVNFPTKVAESVLYNPTIFSLLGAVGGYEISNAHLMYVGREPTLYFTYNNLKWIVPAAFLGYVISSTAKKLQRNITFTIPKKRTDPKPRDIIKHAYNLAIENPLTTAMLTSTGLTQTFFGLQETTQNLAEKAVFFSVFSFLTESYIKLLRTEKRTKKAPKAKATVQDYIDRLLEHPGLVALAAGSARAAYTFYELNLTPRAHLVPHNLKQEIIISLNERILPCIISGIGYGLIAGASAIVLANFLHSQSRSNIKFNLKTAKARLAGDKDLELKIREEYDLPEGPTKTENLVRIGNLYLKEGNNEKAVLAYKSAIKTLAREPHYNNYELLRAAFSTDIPTRLKNALNLSNNLETAVALMLNGNIKRATELLQREKEKKKAQTEEENAKISYLLLLTARYANDKNAMIKYSNDITHRFKEEELIILGRNKSVVKTPIGNFWDREIILKYGDYYELKREFEMTNEIAAVIAESKDARFLAPSPIAVIRLNVDRYDSTKGVYLIDYELGETLAQHLLKNPDGTKKRIGDVADFLALIHARVPTSIVYGKRDHEEEIIKRMKDLHLSPYLTQKIKACLPPFIEALQPCRMVYDKDSHSANWMLTEDNKVIVLDCENRYRNQRERDIANLTDTWELFTKEEKQKILERVNQSYSAYRGIKINQNESRFAYLNAVVIKALEDIPPLHQRKDFERMHAVLSNAQKSIKAMQKEFESRIDYKEQRRITTMKSCLEELEMHLK